MNDTPLQVAEEDTREKLLNAAQAQFAELGFHGASISRIAGEVGLTKQALLYHFKRKEDLYSEVLRRISVRLLDAMRTSHDPRSSPEQQFEDTIMGIYASACAHPLDTRVLMREVLDDQRRDAPPEHWFHKTWLDEIVDRLDAVEGQGALSHAEKFARIFQLIAAIQVFVASKSVLARFYGEEGHASIAQAYPEELRKQVRLIIGR